MINKKIIEEPDNEIIELPKTKKKKKHGKLFKIIDSILVFFVLFCIISLSIGASKGDMPSVFGLSISKVQTGSMEPTLDIGDIVLIKSANFDDISVDDIVVYKSEEFNIFIIHRVIEKNDNDRTLVTKGDNNPAADTEIVTEDMISGEYRKTMFNMGGSTVFDNKAQLFMILMVLVFLVVIVQAINIAITYKLEKEKIQKKEKESNDLVEMRKRLIEEELERMKNSIQK